MPDESPQPDQSLHLPSLVIKNFRGIDELTIPRLGRVTLLAGKNGVGKTTVLDAVRVWAARGHRLEIAAILRKHDEIVATFDEDNVETTYADWDSLFYGRPARAGKSILIGPCNDSGALEMAFSPLDDDEISRVERQQSMTFDGDEVLALRVTFGDLKRTLLPHGVSVSNRQTRRSDRAGSSREIIYDQLGPDVPDNETIEQYFNALALTPEEDRAIQALNLVTNPSVERAAMVDIGPRVGATGGRRSIVKLEGQDEPVPLRSLGDGAVRIFAVALALAYSSGGFLLIDEAENGIHHSIQPKFWKMVLQTAQRNNVQVIATTHSWDCVTGFAQAANELEDVEGLLVRLERVPAGLRVFTYDESRLNNISENRIEVR